MGKKNVPPQLPSGFVVGICILAVGTLGFLAGFASPYWHFSRREDGGVRVLGLWTTCDEDSATLCNCRDNVVRVKETFRAVQFVQCLALLVLLGACVLAVLVHFTDSKVCLRLLDISAGFGALLAVFAALAYLLYTLSEETHFITFSWGFCINVTGSLLCAVAAILMAACRASPAGPDGKGEHRFPRSQAGMKNPSGSSRNVKPFPVTGERRATDKKSWLLPHELHWTSNI